MSEAPELPTSKWFFVSRTDKNTWGGTGMGGFGWGGEGEQRCDHLLTPRVVQARGGGYILKRGS